MYDDAYTRNENDELAVRTVSTTGDTGTNPNDVYTRDENGKLCLRVTGSGGSDQHNLGYYASPTALQEAHPTGEPGDYAIVGSTDTIWIWDEDNSQWVDTDTKGQVESVNGQTGQVNIKSVNGNSLMGSGDIELSTYLTYPNGWTTSGTTKAFCDAVAADTSATKGKAYLGEVTFSDLPASIVNAEVIVEIIDGTTAQNKVIVLTCTSGNTAPYKWQYTYWNGGSDASGWKTWATSEQGAKADTAVQPSDLATVATSGSYNDLSNKPTPVQVSEIPVASVSNEGQIVQFTGTTDENYTNGYFYKSARSPQPESATISQTVGTSLSNIRVNLATFKAEEQPTGDEVVDFVSKGESTVTQTWDSWNDTGDPLQITISGNILPFLIAKGWSEADIMTQATGNDLNVFVSQYDGHIEVMVDEAEYPMFSPNPIETTYEELGQYLTISGTFISDEGEDGWMDAIRVSQGQIGWYKNGTTLVNIYSYGISYSGTPVINDTLTVSYKTAREYSWVQTDVQKGLPSTTSMEGRFLQVNSQGSVTWTKGIEVVTVMPDARPASQGIVVQYMGTTNEFYTHGHFYENAGYWWRLIEVVNPEDIKAIPQYSVMPTASVDNLGNICQFVGTTDANYTNGYFYKCVSDGGNPETYSWSQVDVQPAGASGEFVPQYSVMPVASVDNVDDIAQFIGISDINYTNGYFYKSTYSPQAEAATIEQIVGTSLSNINVNLATFKAEEQPTGDEIVTFNYKQGESTVTQTWDSWNDTGDPLQITISGNILPFLIAKGWSESDIMTQAAGEEPFIVNIYQFEGTVLVDVDPEFFPQFSPNPIETTLEELGQYLTISGTFASDEGEDGWMDTIVVSQQIGWYKNNTTFVNISDYGITYSGTPVVNDMLEVRYNTAKEYRWLEANVQKGIPSTTSKKGCFLQVDRRGNTVWTNGIEVVAYMPSASSVSQGTIVQYRGIANENYTHGHFYESDGSSWSVVGVLNAKEAGAIPQYYSMPIANASNVWTICQFTGPTNANYTNGYFYRCISDGLYPETYSWSRIDVQPQFDLTSISGYDATKTQVLKNIQGVFTWVDES